VAAPSLEDELPVTSRSPSLLIIADDLTGALDTSAPFAAAGLRVRVALDAGHVAEALADSPDVVAISTRSRGLAESGAVAAVARAASSFAGSPPRMVLKKVDSRLKGHPGAESAALAKAFGRRTLVVAPAAPEQERVTVDGGVVGRGVTGAISIAAAFAETGCELSIAPDVRTADDLARIAGDIDWPTSVAVGARGLGAAVARLLAGSRRVEATASVPFRPRARTLIALGSRDPITEAQVESLAAARPDLVVVDALHGNAEVRPLGLPLLVRCTGERVLDAAEVAARFARTAVGLIRATTPEVAIIGGGDTAAAILSDLGMTSLALRGEALPGLPCFEAGLGEGTRIVFVTKSGGFGDVDALCRLVPAP